MRDRAKILGLTLNTPREDTMKKLLATTALVLTGMTGTAFADGVTACLITKTDTNPFFVKMREGATEAANANGINLLTYAAPSTVTSKLRLPRLKPASQRAHRAS